MAEQRAVSRFLYGLRWFLWVTAILSGALLVVTYLAGMRDTHRWAEWIVFQTCIVAYGGLTLANRKGK
jgi:hypothetical protein